MYISQKFPANFNFACMKKNSLKERVDFKMLNWKFTFFGNAIKIMDLKSNVKSIFINLSANLIIITVPRNYVCYQIKKQINSYYL